MTGDGVEANTPGYQEAGHKGPEGQPNVRVAPDSSDQFIAAEKEKSE